MRVVKYTRYPNNEIRAVHYGIPVQKPLNSSVPVSVEIPPEGDSVPVLGLLPEPSPLVISEDIAEKQMKPGFGVLGSRTVFGAAARNTLLRIGGVIDRMQVPAHEWVFLTGTIPGGTHEAFEAMARYSGFTVKRVKDWVSYYATRSSHFFVWEFQQRGALHLHYCCHAPSGEKRAAILSGFKSQWAKILDAIQEDSGVDMWLRADGSYHIGGRAVLRADAQEVNKCVVAYLAGYCSGGKSKHSVDSRFPWYPARWWGASRELTRALAEATEEIVVEIPSYVDARREMLLHYEQVAETASKKYRYPHKVGIGESVISYHPEDNGEMAWQQIKLKHPSKMNTQKSCCGIPQLRKFVAESFGSMPECQKFGPRSDLLSTNGSALYSLSLTSLGSTSDRALLTLLRDSTSDLSFAQLVSRIPPVYHEPFRIALQWTNRNWTAFKFNNAGGLLNEDCVPYSLDTAALLCYDRTIDTDTTGGLEGLDKIARPVPFLQQSLF